MPVRIQTYEQAFNLIKVPYDAEAKRIIAKLEAEGHNEESICFAIWKEQKYLILKGNSMGFWKIFIKQITKWSWPKGDPRWDKYWKKKDEAAKAKQIKKIKEDKTLYDIPYDERITGFIYFVQGENGGPIKIGYATDVADRIISLQTGYPDNLKLLLAFPGNHQYEKQLHKQFSKFQLRGEWFKPEDELLKQIKYMDLLNKRLKIKYQNIKNDSYLR